MHKVVYGLEFSCIQVVYGLELTAYTNVFMLLILCQLHNFNLVNHATDRQMSAILHNKTSKNIYSMNEWDERYQLIKKLKLIVDDEKVRRQHYIHHWNIWYTALMCV